MSQQQQIIAPRVKRLEERNDALAAKIVEDAEAADKRRKAEIQAERDEATAAARGYAAHEAAEERAVMLKTWQGRTMALDALLERERQAAQEAASEAVAARADARNEQELRRKAEQEADEAKKAHDAALKEMDELKKRLPKKQRPRSTYRCKVLANRDRIDVRRCVK